MTDDCRETATADCPYCGNSETDIALGDCSIDGCGLYVTCGECGAEAVVLAVYGDFGWTKEAKEEAA